MSAGRPLVTVYTPCHNYGRFLAEAVESVLAQSYRDWELLIIDDGSTDETAAIADHYAGQRPEQIRVSRHSPARGLPACANLAIDMAHGEYVMRLDADDYLDESALLVMADYLTQHPETGLVYPNYFYVDIQGNYLGLERRKKIGSEAKLLDLPTHGACTLVRKRVLKSIGGYTESYAAQDGQELWLKVLNRYPVANISTPLFYYRQHRDSTSRDERRLLTARQHIKRGLAERHDGRVKPRVVAIIPAKNTYAKPANVVLDLFAGRPLIDYTLEAARDSGVFDTLYVTTDDPQVVDYCRPFPDVLATVRPGELSQPQVGLSQVLAAAVTQLEQTHQIYPDILVLLSLHCPLRRPEHIREAVDTLLLYNVDNVISVYEDYDLHFMHGEHGLRLLNKGMLERLRLEREALYVDNNAIHAMWREVITEGSLYGRRIGHVVMAAEESLQVRSPFEAWVVEQALVRGRAATPWASYQP